MSYGYFFLLKIKLCIVFNLEKIKWVLVFSPIILNLGFSLFYGMVFIQQKIYFYWDFNSFNFYFKIPNLELTHTTHTTEEHNLKNLFWEPNYRNDDNANPNEQDPNPRPNRPRRNNHELAEPREIRRLIDVAEFLLQDPVLQEPKFRGEPHLGRHPYFWQLARGYYWLPAGDPTYEFSIDQEIIYNNNNGFLNRERLGGEPRLNRTSFGNALMHEYSVCLREDSLPVDGNPRYLEVYLTQACRQLDNSVYMTYFAPALREEIFWSLYGSLRLEYLLTHPLELEQPTLDEHMIVD
jgi:hypothetical protein